MGLVKLCVALGGSLALVVAAPQPARSTTMLPQKFTCPIGGEEFQGSVIASYSTFGQRPDGRSYGTLPVYPIVECPGNGFLLFEDKFSEEEIALLEPAVASAEYQAMRTSETPSYRVWWLMKKLGREPVHLVSALLHASWESDQSPARKARYQAAFVAAATELQRTDDNGENWFWYNLRAANALRELGRFDEAAALLGRIDQASLLPTDPDQLEGAQFLITGLQALIGERNSVAEPTNLIPPMIAVERCGGQSGALTASEQSACAAPEYREAIQQQQEYESRIADEDGGTDPAEAARTAATDAVAAAAQAAANAER